MGFEKLKKMFKRQKPVEPPRQPPLRTKKRVCRKIIKRDSDGRIKEERYEGCSEQEIKMMREQREE